MAEPADARGDVTVVDPGRAELPSVFLRHQVEFIVSGGAAIQSHGRRFDTQDIDLTPDADETNLRRLAAALNERPENLVPDRSRARRGVWLVATDVQPLAVCRLHPDQHRCTHPCRLTGVGALARPRAALWHPPIPE